QTGNLGNVKVNGTSASAYSTPYIGRIDNEQKDYLVTGSYSGKLYKYTGFQTGNVSSAFQILDSVYSLIHSKLNPYSGYRSAPAFADVDNDGNYELILGNAVGGVTIFKQSKQVSETGNLPEFSYLGNAVTIYPNPVKNKQLNIRFRESYREGTEVCIGLYSVSGTKIFEKKVRIKNGLSTLALTDVKTGIYFVRILSDKNTAMYKIVVEE